MLGAVGSIAAGSGHMSGDDDMMMMWNPSLWRNRRHDLTRRALHDLTLWLREQLERGREGACQPRRGEDPPQPGAHPDPLSLFRDPSSLARAKSRLVLAVTAAVVCGASCTVGCGLRCDMTCSRNKLSSFCFCGSLVVGLGLTSVSVWRRSRPVCMWPP